MAEHNDTTPIADAAGFHVSEGEDSAHGTSFVTTVTGIAPSAGRSAEEDDNDSDCLSTTTSCTALGASHSNLIAQRSCSISSNSKVSSFQPQQQEHSEHLSRHLTHLPSRGSSYDNPGADLTDEVSPAHSQIVLSADEAATASSHASPARRSIGSSAKASPVPPKLVGGSSADLVTESSYQEAPASLPSSTSVPTGLRASGSSSLVISSGASPAHVTATTSGTTAAVYNSATTPPATGITGHRRGSSSVSGTVGSGIATVCHSRGASTEGSTIDAFTATESRRGTYSEAGTLPIGGSVPEGSLGGTIFEEEHPLEKMSEKKLSNGSLADSSRRERNRKSVFSCCLPLMQSHNPLPANPSRSDRIRYAFTCPPHGKVGEFLTNVLVFFLTWGALYVVTGEMAVPGGVLFSLLVVFVCSVLGGMVSEACRLPPLLGMLLAGIALRSVPGVKIIGDSLEPQWSSSIRNIALVIILLRAGLGLDPKALKAMSFVVLRLAFTPCLVETTVVAIVAHFLLDFPWLWGFMLGFVLAAVSPAVVVPGLLQLSQLGYGLDKGIPTLVIAAASVDDVISISGFGVVLSMAFSSGGNLVWQILQGPIEVMMGLGYGLLLGLLFWMLPNKHHKSCSLLQFVLLVTAGVFALFGSQRVKFGGAGALAVLCMAFVAGVGYRRQGWENDDNIVGHYCNQAWRLLQPMLFALIGTEIQVLSLQLDTIGLGLATLCVSLTCRAVTTFFVVLGSGLNVRERLFVAFAWLPKATVQAAIGGTALDYANRINATEDQFLLARQVLTISVLVILITAPIGAIAIMTSAPRLLHRTRPSNPDAI